MAITDANRWETPDPTALHGAAPLVFRMFIVRRRDSFGIANRSIPVMPRVEDRVRRMSTIADSGRF